MGVVGEDFLVGRWPEFTAGRWAEVRAWWWEPAMRKQPDTEPRAKCEMAFLSFGVIVS